MRIIHSMDKHEGKVTLNPDIDVWPHELKTAQALASVGYEVSFLKRKQGKYERTADVVIDGIAWEMKSPKSSKLKRVERTLRDALHQSPYVIFDSQRIKGLSDTQIRIELEKWSEELRGLKGLIYVTKKRTVLVIK